MLIDIHSCISTPKYCACIWLSYNTNQQTILLYNILVFRSAVSVDENAIYCTDIKRVHFLFGFHVIKFCYHT